MSAKRTDANQAHIVKVLRSLGAKVAITSVIGRGFPDLVVGYRKKIFLMEVKDGAKPPSQRKLTACEIVFHNDWAGYVHVVVSPEQAVDVVVER